MDIQVIKDQINLITGYKDALIWMLKEAEKDLAKQKEQESSRA